MSEVASLELCKELYELSGWIDPSQNGYSHVPGAPYYSLGYLLRKLAVVQMITLRYVHSGYRLSLDSPEWYDKWICFLPDTRQGDYIVADTPEDAVCKLAIELWKQGIFK